MKKILPLAAALGLVCSPAFAGFASGPATPAETPAPQPVATPMPTLDDCHAFCNAPSGSMSNMASQSTINGMCPADSIARGGDVVYKIVPKN